MHDGQNLFELLTSYSGEWEVDEYIQMMYQMEESLNSVGFEEVSSKVIPNGQHNEATWRDDFGAAYLWLFPSFANDVRSNVPIEELKVKPNPVKERISR